MPRSFRRVVTGLCAVSLTVGATGCSALPWDFRTLLASPEPLEVVPFVDLQRYAGRWYEIAKYPAFFQGANCVGATAEYALRPDGNVDVVNRCYAGALDGPERSVEAVARVVDPQTNAKLKVAFFGGLVEGDYWIIDLDPDYQWAVVGDPRRAFLWILSRTPSLDADVYAAIVARLPDKGYDPARLEPSVQPSE